MKISVSSKIFTALAGVIQVSALLPRLEESNLNLRAEATCGDVSNLAPFTQVYVPASTQHVYSIYNNNVTNFFVGNPSAQYQGIAAFIFSIQDTSTVPFYCLHNSAVTAFLYTANQTELAIALASGYTLSFTAGYIYPTQICGSVPLYRLHFIAANSDYIYTTSVTDRENAIAMGFTYEGVAGYVYDVLSCGSSS
ncbi:hypothetical protein B0H16DRAFT_134628 [Mycena metata]|uniref:DUF5648 domain-containing protein n=1 Tax=Mycena metata TaxID=1033252 RepID=A0AAD7I4T7_9AGAR|nr:hypothetical protein B0H16DRAFT_134628 [Mycena metata]